MNEPVFGTMVGERAGSPTPSVGQATPSHAHTSPISARLRPGHNPIVTEIVRNGLVAVTEEMKINLMRTAYNMIIYEALDFTVGLFDRDGNTVSIGLGLRCSSAA